MAYVVIINVIDILNGQKFSFPMNSDSAYRIKHLKHEMESLVHRFGDHRLLFIRNGRVADDEELILPPSQRNLDPDSKAPIDFYFMAQPKEKVLSAEDSVCVIDEICLTAAKEWMTSHSSYSNTSEVKRRQYILQSMQQLNPQTTDTQAEGNDAPHTDITPPTTAPLPLPLPIPAVIEEQGIRWFDPHALCRLGISLFVFFQASPLQGYDSLSKISMCLFSMVYYLHETGIGRLIFNYFVSFISSVERARRGNENENRNGYTPLRDANTNTETDSDSTSTQLPQTDHIEAPPGDELWTTQLSQRLTTLYQNGLPIPAGRVGGILADSFCLFGSLALSLVPEWSPYGRVKAVGFQRWDLRNRIATEI